MEKKIKKIMEKIEKEKGCWFRISGRVYLAERKNGKIICRSFFTVREADGYYWPKFELGIKEFNDNEFIEFLKAKAKDIRLTLY